MSDTPEVFIHPAAIVDDGATIGEGTKIWHFVHVMSGARIGDNSMLGQNVYVGSNAVIGNGVRIQNNVSVYDEVELEDDVFVGPSAVFTNVKNPRSHVNRRDAYGRTLVQKGASIGANATIVTGITIGRYAFIGSGAVVTRDIPDYGLAFGNPARLRGWVCSCGIKLPFQEKIAQCPECGTQYLKISQTCIEMVKPEHQTSAT